MRNLTEENLTDIVIERIASANPRSQEVIVKLIKHLHAFIRDIEPTEKEWFQAIDFLTRTGQKCDDKRQEFILLSDVLGVSMLVDAINHRTVGDETESTVTGPFHTEANVYPMGENIAKGEEVKRGEMTVVSGRILDPDGNPISHALIDVWQADDVGYYDIQDSNQPEMNLRGVFETGPDGTFWFKTIKPTAYPVPTDGPVGELLNASGRHPMRPAHIHFWIKAAGYEDLITHIFVEGDEYLDSDAVFGVKESLILAFNQSNDQSAAERYDVKTPFYDVSYDFKLTRKA